MLSYHEKKDKTTNDNNNIKIMNFYESKYYQYF